uniref:hypothetical protein n=1 Tax=Nocardia carnea TaxID=37328 RepID=UPI002457D48B
MIDRESVVRRHTVTLTTPDPSCPVTVGNGDFGFTADITGMQTFTAFHDQTAAYPAGRSAVNTATMTSWGWHSMPNPDGFVLDDALSTYETPRGPVQYPDRFDMAAVFGAEVPEEYRAGTWLHVNPHRLDLARIGLALRPRPGTPAVDDPAVLDVPHQQLDLWTGTVTSAFAYAGREMRVTTVADPRLARVAFRIESALLTTGQAAVAVRFPYASAGFFHTADWSVPERHRTVLERTGDRSCVFGRTLDDTEYSVRLEWSGGRLAECGEPHHFELTAADDILELVATFLPMGGVDPGPGEFAAARG